ASREKLTVLTLRLMSVRTPAALSILILALKPRFAAIVSSLSLSQLKPRERHGICEGRSSSSADCPDCPRKTIDRSGHLDPLRGLPGHGRESTQLDPCAPVNALLTLHSRARGCSGKCGDMDVSRPAFGRRDAVIDAGPVAARRLRSQR